MKPSTEQMEAELVLYFCIWGVLPMTLQLHSEQTPYPCGPVALLAGESSSLRYSPELLCIHVPRPEPATSLRRWSYYGTDC